MHVRKSALQFLRKLGQSPCPGTVLFRFKGSWDIAPRILVAQDAALVTSILQMRSSNFGPELTILQESPWLPSLPQGILYDRSLSSSQMKSVPFFISFSSIILSLDARSLQSWSTQSRVAAQSAKPKWKLRRPWNNLKYVARTRRYSSAK